MGEMKFIYFLCAVFNELQMIESDLLSCKRRRPLILSCIPRGLDSFAK